MPAPLRATDLRTAAWHLRAGGVGQVREWMRRRTVESRNGRVDRAQSSPQKRYPAVTPLPHAAAFPDVTAGVILDEFSASAFSPEWNSITLSRRRWKEQIRGIDLLFVESAWNGNSGEWQYQLTGASGVKADFRALVEACRASSVPTVFWNKEDPPHFEDFIEAASLFDVVFTSDSRLVPTYRERLGHDRVHVMSFAAQPALHNPARPAGPRAEEGTAFAGMYFAHKYPERREQMDWLLGGAADAAAKDGERFDVYSRFSGGDERYQFPDELAHHVVGSLPYPQMLSAYADYKAFLNVNSVVDSPSMCARRVFEITACGTPVVSAPSDALEEFFPADEVFQPRSRREAELILRALHRSPELRDRAVHLGQRRIWREHTYAHRVADILAAAGIEHANPHPSTVSALAVTNRPHQLRHLLESIAAQDEVDVQTVLVTHGFTPAPNELADLRRAIGIDEDRLIHRPADSSLALGDCLSLALDAADGDVVAKMDDDDLYGPHYLADQLAALRYSGASLVGKQAHFMHLAHRDVLLLRFPEREHKFTNLVMGPTMVGHAEVFRTIGFSSVPRGEDTDFQSRLLAEGGAVYSADRFNFIQMRRGDGAHTWDADDALLLANGEVHSYGIPRKHVFF